MITAIAVIWFGQIPWIACPIWNTYKLLRWMWRKYDAFDMDQAEGELVHDSYDAGAEGERMGQA